LISKRTLRVLFPMVSNTSRSTSPVGMGLGLLAVSGDGALAPKSRGIGGSTFVLGDVPVPEAVVGEGGMTSISCDGPDVSPFCWKSATAV